MGDNIFEGVPCDERSFYTYFLVTFAHYTCSCLYDIIFSNAADVHTLPNPLTQTSNPAVLPDAFTTLNPVTCEFIDAKIAICIHVPATNSSSLLFRCWFRFVYSHEPSKNVIGYTIAIADFRTDFNIRHLRIALPLHKVAP